MEAGFQGLLGHHVQVRLGDELKPHGDERVVDLALALELGLVLVLLGERILHLLEPVVVQPGGVHMDARESGAARPAELDRHVDRAVRVIRVVNRNADVLEHEIPLISISTLASAGGPQPRDGLRLALLLHLASAGGAPAPRRPAARTTSSPRLGRRGPSPATACGSHYALTAARIRPSPSPSARSSALSSWSAARRRGAARPCRCLWAGNPRATW